MGQEFMVVKCCTCEMFQVQQVKKSSKWACKVCGQEQSLQLVYSRGTGAECRKAAQELNMRKGETHAADRENLLDKVEVFEELAENGGSHGNANGTSRLQHEETNKRSRWEAFADKNSDEEMDDLDKDQDLAHVVTSRPPHTKYIRNARTNKSTEQISRPTNRPAAPSQPMKASRMTSGVSHKPATKPAAPKHVPHQNSRGVQQPLQTQSSDASRVPAPGPLHLASLHRHTGWEGNALATDHSKENVNSSTAAFMNSRADTVVKSDSAPACGRIAAQSICLHPRQTTGNPNSKWLAFGGDSSDENQSP